MEVCEHTVLRAGFNPNGPKQLGASGTNFAKTTSVTGQPHPRDRSSDVCLSRDGDGISDIRRLLLRATSGFERLASKAYRISTDVRTSAAVLRRQYFGLQSDFEM